MANTNINAEDKFVLGGHEFSSRFILGSGKYNLELVEAAVNEAKAEIITLALRRANSNGEGNILDYIPKGVTLLPNTSGARNAEEAVRIARLSRELGCGDFVKIEVIQNIFYRIIMKRLRLQKCLQKKDLLYFHICILTLMQQETL